MSLASLCVAPWAGSEVTGISQSKERLARRLASRRGRERTGLALAEGPEVILEALRSEVEVRWLLLGEEYRSGPRGREIAHAARERQVETLLATDAAVARLCTTEAPRAALACVVPLSLEPASLSQGRHLLAVGVQVPGNLGALVRSAWALGLDGVAIGPGTVDPWNPKAVRASAGSVFHLPLLAPPPWVGGEVGGGASAAPPGGVNLLYADATGTPPEEVAEAREPDWVLVVGNEGRGIAPLPRGPAPLVAVPLARGADSLNVAVAGSILMYRLMQLSGPTGRERRRERPDR